MSTSNILSLPNSPPKSPPKASTPPRDLNKSKITKEVVPEIEHIFNDYEVDEKTRRKLEIE